MNIPLIETHRPESSSTIPSPKRQIDDDDDELNLKSKKHRRI